MPDKDAIREAVEVQLREVRDPELPVNVLDLGLIYGIDVADDGKVKITMTLTNPNCPVADQIPRQVAEAVKQADGVSDAEVELTWDPPWNMSRMSEAARLDLEV